MRLRGGTDFGKPTRFSCKNGEVEPAFREHLLMRQSDLYRDGNFKLVAKWGKCVNVLGLGGGGELCLEIISATLTVLDFVANY
jgi:hypothetical protein